MSTSRPSNAALLRAFLPAGIPSALLLGVMGLGAWVSAHDPLNYNRGMGGDQNPFWLIQALIAICLGFFVYFLPTSIAAYRGSRHYWGILITNALGFMAGIPWLIALVWSVLPTDRPVVPSAASELDRLASLRGQGLISEDEFTAAKKRLLS